jgi:predicted transcriptional regulator
MKNPINPLVAAYKNRKARVAELERKVEQLEKVITDAAANRMTSLNTTTKSLSFCFHILSAEKGVARMKCENISTEEICVKNGDTVTVNFTP